MVSSDSNPILELLSELLLFLGHSCENWDRYLDRDEI